MPRGKMLNAVKYMGVTGNLYRAVAATYDDNTSVVLTSDRQRRTEGGGRALAVPLQHIHLAGLIRALKKKKAPARKECTSETHGWDRRCG
jgi:hypothetical protein